MCTNVNSYHLSEGEEKKRHLLSVFDTRSNRVTWQFGNPPAGWVTLGAASRSVFAAGQVDPSDLTSPERGYERESTALRVVSP